MRPNGIPTCTLRVLSLRQDMHDNDVRQALLVGLPGEIREELGFEGASEVAA